MISDTLSDAAGEIRDYLEEMPDIYGPYSEAIGKVLGVMDTLRRAFDTTDMAETKRLIATITADSATPDLLEYAERALDQLTNDREEECWCQDEVDGAPDAPPFSPCLACHLREAIGKAKGAHR